MAHQLVGRSLPVGKLDVYKKCGSEKGMIGDLEDNVFSLTSTRAGPGAK